MFFRHERAKTTTFEDHMSAARAAGFKTQPAGSGTTRIERNGIACTAKAGADGTPLFVERAGVVIGNEIGALTDGGYQKFFSTTSGKGRPAQAQDLMDIQNFQEDLREVLGLTSLYNESLGTVSTRYLYDRVEGRDQAPVHKAWE